MASSNDRLRTVAAFAATVASSAVLWWFGFGVTPHWWATWLAPLPVLVYATRARSGAAFAAALLAWAIGGLSLLSYAQKIQLPATIIVLGDFVPALIFALTTLLFRALLRRGRPLLGALAVPATLIAYDYLSANVSPHGTFNNLAYTQMDALAVIQIAALCGSWGITFLVFLLPSALAAGGAAQTTASGRRALLAAGVLVYAIAFGYGGWRLQSATAEDVAQARIGLVSLAGKVRPPLADPAGEKLLQRYLAQLERLADAGAKTIVMPETVFLVTTPDVPALAEFARRRGVRLIAGVGYDGAGEPSRNAIFAFPPDGATPERYSKQHLLPGFEDHYTAGTESRTLASEPGTGLAICKDMDFLSTGRAYAERGTNLLLVPAWDFELDGWLHGRMAILRSVENGFALARAARDGTLTLNDDRGRVVAEASSIRIDDAATLVGDLPLRHTRTLYARWGDWLAWLAVAVLVIAIATALLTRPSR